MHNVYINHPENLSCLISLKKTIRNKTGTLYQLKSKMNTKLWIIQRSIQNELYEQWKNVKK